MNSASAVPVVWSDATRAHRPEREVWIGMPMEGTEVPERVTVINETLRAGGHPFIEAIQHDETPLTRVHSPELIRHLSTAYDAWVDGGFVAHGQDRVVPYFFPTAAMLGPIEATRASSI